MPYTDYVLRPCFVVGCNNPLKLFASIFSAFDRLLSCENMFPFWKDSFHDLRRPYGRNAITGRRKFADRKGKAVNYKITADRDTKGLG